MTCAEECIFANAQRIKKSAISILHEVQTENDYYLEKSAHLIHKLSIANESLAQYTAELHQSYENSKTVYELLPHLALMTNEGQHMFTTLKNADAVKPDSQTAK